MAAVNRMAALGGFVVKEVRHLLRDKQTLAILVLMPLAQVLLYGYAVRTDVRNIRLAVVDPTPDVRTAALVGRFEASDRYIVTLVTPTRQGLEGKISSGEIRQAIVLPDRVADRLQGAAPLSVQVITDASDPNTGSLMEGYASAQIRRWAAESAPLGAIPPGIEVRTQLRFNPTMESAQLFVPGLIALVLTIVSAMMTAISVTREKETGTMEMLLVSPLHPWEIVAGKVVPYVVLGMFNVGMVLTAATQVFHVPIRGSLALLLAECLLYIVTALSLGIVISSRATTQRTAMLAALGGLLLPTVMLSGFIFPIASMPLPLQLISNIIPAKWFLLIVRGVMLKGAGLATLWQETLILMGLTALLLTIGIRRLSVRLS